MHLVMNPVIEVNGDKGKGRWYIFEPVTFAEWQQAGSLAEAYDDDYVKVNGHGELPASPFQTILLDTVQKAVVEQQIWARVNPRRSECAKSQDSRKVYK